MTKSSTVKKLAALDGKVDHKKLKGVRGGSGSVSVAVHEDVSDAALDIIVHEEVIAGDAGNPVGEIQTLIKAEFVPAESDASPRVVEIDIQTSAEAPQDSIPGVDAVAEGSVNVVIVIAVSLNAMPLRW